MPWSTARTTAALAILLAASPVVASAQLKEMRQTIFGMD